MPLSEAEPAPAAVSKAVTESSTLEAKEAELFTVYQPGEDTTIVSVGDTWHYWKGVAEPLRGWNTAVDGYNDTVWLTGPTGIGYGDNDEIPPLTNLIVHVKVTSIE